MSVSPHYDEEALIALLDRPRSISNDEHVSSCETCSSVLDSYRSIIETLGEKPVWNFGRTLGEPVKKTITALRAAAASMRSEDEQAESLFAELTAGPREEWMPRLVGDAKFRTAAVARRLLVAAEAVAFKSPADDVEMARLATEIADQLDRTIDPAAIARLRGCAWREVAWALNYAGESAAALEAIAAAEACFDEVPVSDHEIGRLELTRALVLRALDRLPDGLRAVRCASKLLTKVGDYDRVRVARSIEAYLLYRAGDLRAALQRWHALKDEIAPEDPMRGGVLHNIALVYRELGDVEPALQYLREAADAFAQSGSTTNVLKARWSLGNLLKSQQRFERAEQVFRDVIGGFEELQMREDVVLARLDLAEVLIIGKRFNEAAEICSGVVEELRTVGLEHTARALTAVSFLTEATVARKATPVLVGRVRDFVREVRTQPSLLFAPPPLE